jgi:hypothetical protein
LRTAPAAYRGIRDANSTTVGRTAVRIIGGAAKPAKMPGDFR